MAQDYAKQRVPTGMRRRPMRAATKAVPETSGTHWSWYFSGLISGVVLVVGGYLGAEKLQADAELAAQVAQGSAQAQEDSAELPIFNFGFYNDLANAEVAVDITAATETGMAGAAAAATTATDSPQRAAPQPTSASTAKAPDPEAEVVRYRLQAGSFQSREDAETQRARITLLNMSASVVPGVVSGRTHHRVQVGPFNGRQSAEQARDILAENNIESIPLLMR